MNKTLMIVHSGFEIIEALSVIDILRALDVDVDICSVENEYVKSFRDVVIKTDLSFDDIQEKGYNCLIFPGGPGANELMKNKKILDLTRNFHKDNKVIAAICGGPQILSESGILKDKSATSHPKVQSNINCAKYETQPVVVDGNIITSQAPGTALDFAFSIAEKLCSKEKIKDLKEHFII